MKPASVQCMVSLPMLLELSDIHVRAAGTAEFPAAQRFYDACGYGGAAIVASDQVLIAEAGGQIVAVGRLSREQGVLCLRGMQVASRLHGNGVGQRLLQGLATQMRGEECWCLPYRTPAALLCARRISHCRG